MSIIDDFKKRGVFSSSANEENFLNLKNEQKKVYWGIDCTSDSLHIGHLLPIMQAVRLVKNNFKIIILLGGSTSMIGDPSDKLKERPFLEKIIIEKNKKSIHQQLKKIFEKKIKENFLKKLPLVNFFKDELLIKSIYKILELDFDFKKKDLIWKKYLTNIWPEEVKKENFQILDNKKWLSKLNLINFVNEFGRNITVNYLLSKETVKKRMESGVSFLSFIYPLLQGYDFIHLYKNYNCQGQIGASDQWGNFTTGLKMIKNVDNDNKCFAISFNLILDDKGGKISKSTSGNIIWTKEKKTPFKILFDYFNNMEDSKAIDFAKKFTFIDIEKINKLLEINNPKSLRILQRILLELFFFLIHGMKGLKWIEKKLNKN